MDGRPENGVSATLNRHTTAAVCRLELRPESGDGQPNAEEESLENHDGNDDDGDVGRGSSGNEKIKPIAVRNESSRKASSVVHPALLCWPQTLVQSKVGSSSSGFLVSGVKLQLAGRGQHQQQH